MLQVYMRFEDEELACCHQEAGLTLSFFLPLSYARVSWLTPVIEVAFVGKMDPDFLDTLIPCRPRT